MKSLTVAFIIVCLTEIEILNAAIIPQFFKICQDTTSFQCNPNQILTIANVTQVFGFNTVELDCNGGSANKSVSQSVQSFQTTYCNFNPPYQCNLVNVANLFISVTQTESYLNPIPLRYEIHYGCNGILIVFDVLFIFTLLLF